MLLLWSAHKSILSPFMWFRLLFKAGCYTYRDINVPEDDADTIHQNLNCFPPFKLIQNSFAVSAITRRASHSLHYYSPIGQQYITISGIAELWGWPERSKPGSLRRQNDDLISQALSHVLNGFSIVHDNQEYGEIEYRFYLEKNDLQALKIITPVEWPSIALDIITGIIGLTGKIDIYQGERLAYGTQITELVYPHEITFFNNASQNAQGGTLLCELTKVTEIEDLVKSMGYNIIASNPLQ